MQKRTQWAHRALAWGAAAVVGLGAGAASASHVVWFDVVGGESGGYLDELGSETSTPDGVNTWSLDDPLVLEGIEISSWSAAGKPDPYVTNNIVVTNTTGSTQTFIATVLLNIPAFAYDEIVFSSVGVTVTDSNGNNVLSFAQNGATAIYQGLINGSTALNLTPPNVPLTTADCSPFPNTNGCSATDSAGVVSQPSGPGIATQIGITLTFDLSAGDSAGITSRFEIVPEPGTAALLLIGLLGLAIRRRA